MTPLSQLIPIKSFPFKGFCLFFFHSFISASFVLHISVVHLQKSHSISTLGTYFALNNFTLLEQILEYGYCKKTPEYIFKYHLIDKIQKLSSEPQSARNLQRFTNTSVKSYLYHR
jgi:hypothetical protein